ncbi:MAG: type II secretion system protein [Burkholderiales bacterium]|nr:type II secretion system protein [Burkholderiales bacterium]
MMRQRGFTYLALLFMVAIMGAVLGATAVVWRTMNQRDKEQELLFIGHEYRRAIGLYYERTPGAAKQFPKKLEDLLEDKRQTTLTRYLRKRYNDPLGSEKEWGLVPGPGGTIMGVYSLSDKTPIKTGNFDEDDKDFASASSFQAWKFVYQAKAAPAVPIPVAPPAAAPIAPPNAPPAVPPSP